MSSDLRTYGLFPTLMAIGTSLSAQVTPPAKCAGMFLKYASGASLAVVGASGVAVSAGYVLGSTDISIDGPATFYMSAGGATAVASIMFKMSAGYSSIV